MGIAHRNDNGNLAVMVPVSVAKDGRDFIMLVGDAHPTIAYSP